MEKSKFRLKRFKFTRHLLGCNLTILILLVSSYAFGQSSALVSFEFAGTNGSASSNADFVISGLETTGYNVASLGSGLTALNYGAVDGLEAKKQEAMTLADAIANNDYISFTVKPLVGSSVTITSIDLKPFSQNSRNRTFSLLSSVNGFSSSNEIGSVVCSDLSGTLQPIGVTGHSNLTNEVEFRIYIYGYNDKFEATGLAGNGDDLVLNGSISVGDTEAPSIPQNLVSSNLTQTIVDINWDASTDNVGVVTYEVFQDGVSLGNTASTSMSVSGLSAQTSYSFTVTASDAAGNTSAPSSALVVTTPDTEAPSVPQNLVSTNITQSNVDVSWDASTDNVAVTAYEVFQNGSSIGTTGSTSISVSGLAASTTYAFTVTALDASGNASAASLAIDVTTSSMAPPSSGVISSYDFAGTNGGASSAADFVALGLETASYNVATFGSGLIALNYGAVDGLECKDVSSVTLADAIAGNEYITFTLKPIAGETMSVTSIDFRPFSQNNIRTFSLLSSIKGFTDTEEIGSTSCGTLDGDLVSISVTGHDNLTEEVEFRIYIYGYNNKWEALGLAGSGDDLIINGTAIGGIGGDDTEAPSVPQNLASANITQTSIDLSWDASTDNVAVTAYEVFQDGTSIGTTATNSMSVSGLTASTTYAFTATASDAAGNVSAASNALNVTTSDVIPGDYINLSKSAINFISAAGNNTFDISSNVSWTISDDASWITVSPTSGSNDAIVTVTVTENTNTSSRNGTVTVTDGSLSETAVIYQAGQTSTNWPAVGMGLPKPTYYMNNSPFADVIKSCRWAHVASWDANGYPASSLAGYTAFARAGVGVATDFPDGDYVITWEGDGDVTFAFSTATLISEDLTSNPKRRVYSVNTDDSGVGVYVNSYPATNIHCYLPGCENEISLWNPEWKNYMSGFQNSVFRMMRIMGTNSSWETNWEDRTPREWSTYVNNNNSDCVPYPVSVKGRGSWEVCIEWANEMNSDIWINIPHPATADYITKLAHLIKTGIDQATGIQTTQPLASNLKVWIEYSNEVWNPNMSGHDWVEANCQGSDQQEKYALKAVDVFNTFKAEWGDDSRLVRVLGSQTAGGSDIWSVTYGILSSVNRADYDALAIATYFTYDYEKFIYENWNNGLSQQAFYDYISNEMGTGAYSITGEPVWANTCKGWSYEWARQFNVPVVAYEGNEHFNMIRMIDTDGDGWGDKRLSNLIPASVGWMKEFCRSQYMYDLMEQNQQRHEQSGLVTMMPFVSHEEWSEDGQWGFAEYLGQPMSEATKYRWLHDHFNLPYPTTNSLKSASILSSSLIEQDLETGIKLYPNPSNNGRVILEMQNIDQATITIYNMDGKTIYQDQSSGKQHYISTSGFKKGLYIVKVKTKEKVENLKLVVQ